MTGRVYLVGAGPGDPGLITRRGLDVLRTCDVVLYDRLVPPELLDEAPPEADRIFVGKRPGETHSRQVVADALLLQRASAGQRVVRLKGGDPFVFGRGGEEAALLAEAKVPFEVVPGVTSAVAVPAYAGIPVTHRGLSSSFAVLTGRDAAGEAPHRWTELARGVDTLVLLMGASGLERVTGQLIDAGRAPDTPAAVIEWGTTASQRVVTGRLDEIATLTARARIGPPATTVVGDVVGVRDGIAWFEARPMFGLRIVVPRAKHQAGSLAGRLAELGARVIVAPVISIEDPESWDALDAAVAGLTGYDWVIFASSNAVERFFGRLRLTGADARAMAGVRVGVVGPATASAVADNGLRPDAVPARYTAAELAAALGDDGGRALWPRVEDAPPEPVAALRAAGWTVDEVVAYRNVAVSVDEFPDEVRAGEFDIVAFTSASTVRNFVAAVGSFDAAVACIGPSTAEEVRRAGLKVAIEAADHTIDGLVDAIAAWVAR